MIVWKDDSVHIIPPILLDLLIVGTTTVFLRPGPQLLLLTEANTLVSSRAVLELARFRRPRMLRKILGRFKCVKTARTLVFGKPVLPKNMLSEIC